MGDILQNNMEKIIIIGAGGHASEIVEYIENINLSKYASTVKYDIVGVIDDDFQNFSKYQYTYKYLGTITNHEYQKNISYVIGIANLKYRKSIVENFLNNGCKFINIIHPTAMISKTAKIGLGNVISHNVSIGPMANIGNFNVINSRVTIGHDSSIQDFNFLSPVVALGGNTSLESHNLIGTSACTIPGISIGSSNTVMAGMVINKSIENNQVVFYKFKEKIILQNK